MKHFQDDRYSSEEEKEYYESRPIGGPFHESYDEYLERIKYENKPIGVPSYENYNKEYDIHVGAPFHND